MVYFTSNIYKMKRKILTFTNKISRHLAKPEKKFTADITYGILASGSCLLTDVVDQLHEPSKKIKRLIDFFRTCSIRERRILLMFCEPEKENNDESVFAIFSTG